MENKPLVSVVIPTYNSEKTLAQCLESVKKQTYKNIEVIVFDKFSKDDTAEIAKKFGAEIFQLETERTKAKNFGAKKSKGKYVCFIDSDMELTSKVIEECISVIQKNEKVGGVIIPERSVGNSFWVKVRDFERSFYAGTEIESARFFRRDLVDKVNGFDEDVVFFEESTLPQKIEKLDFKVKARINSEILHNEYNFSLWKWLKKKYYYGKTAEQYKQKYKSYGSKQISVSNRFGLFLRNKRFYYKPLHASGVLILKVLEYFSSGLGYLMSVVRK
jgi:glycosyltransferase involved in cell wall biosynthesis